MKYPQLVSTRAVNAISDWLVARLEQLGVEAPHIYTRLLLSLLQSTVQLNDPIEFSNLESFLASRKGGNRRYRECDIDELKKFNAVQCIKSIVSTDQEIASIENLVEELFERLKDIEKQSSDSEDDDKLPVATLSITHRSNRSQQRREVPANNKSCRASCGADSDRPAEAAGTSGSAKRFNEREREYWRAFPALSKEMGDSYPHWRHPSKWLSWPAEKPKDDGRQNVSTSSASSTISSNSDAEDGNQAVPINTNAQRNVKGKEEEDAMMGDTVENAENTANVSGPELCDDIVDENDEIDNDEASSSANAAGYASGSGAIKRNSKRRRSRGKSLSRKNLARGNNCGSDSNKVSNNRSQASGGKNKRNLSPSCWDTDFEGCWEMGPDLIKEFIASQNRNSRNRSTSESAVAYNKQSETEIAAAKKEGVDDNCEIATNGEQQQQIDENKPTAEGEQISVNRAVTPILPPVDISFCDYDDFDDTLASVSELTNDGPMIMLATNESACALPPANAKRLYERELLPKDKKSDIQSDFAQFEAKFNSSIEALWKDADRHEEKGFSPFGDDNKLHIFNFGIGSSKHFSGPNSLPTDVPFSKNLKNFWSNYYNHHFDLSKMLPTSVIGEKAKELDVLMQNKANDTGAAAFKFSQYFQSNDGDISEANKISNAPPADAHTTRGSTSDYYSMPSNFEEIEKAKSQRSGLRHNSGCSDSGNGLGVRRGGGTIGEERKTPVALFLQNSIWSENANFGGGDSDETFYFKVHHSGNQLNAYDDNSREEKLQCDATTSGINMNSASSFAFTAPYTASKWSEGINAGPPQGNIATPLLQHKQCGNENNNFRVSLNTADCTDSSSSGACTPGAPNWHLTKGEAKNDLQNVWSAAQMSDTNAARRSPRNTDRMATPKITLVNHSTTGSGFIAYSRIKAVLKLQLSSDDNTLNDATAKHHQQHRNYPLGSNSKEQQQGYAFDMIFDGQNLLTSERTHFQPIKSYADGHTFDISSELDVIEYERSASGYLYYEEEKYLEYTRTDNFIVEDDGGIGASANPLYANSNCEAATTNAKAKHTCRSKSKAKRVERDFVIKFRLQRTEVACQTDAEPPTTARTLLSANKRNVAMNVSTTAAQPHPISLIFSNAAKNLKATATNELVYSDTAEAFTRAMAHFPPPQPSSKNNSAWLSMGADGDGQATSSNWNIYQEQPKLQQNAKKNNNNDEDDDAGCDQVDFNGSIADIADDMDQNGNMAIANAEVDMTNLEQQWSMNEIRKKCKEAGHMNTTADGVDTTIESVWGMCAACNNELKSVPANRLLRDELQVEADEIMSDLKYMQDLYIGSAGDTADTADADDADDEDEDDGCADDESGVETVTSDSDWYAEDVTAEVVDECAINMRSTFENNDDANEVETRRQIAALNQTTTTTTMDSAVNNDSETFTVIQKVNRLIAELLRPDNNGDGAARMDKLNANAACAKINDSHQVEAEATQFSGNLWHTNSNERNIWQLNATDITNDVIIAGGGGVLGKSVSVSGGGGVGAGAMHPMQLLRQFNVKPIESAVTSADNIFSLPAATDVDKYHRQMSWDHENLARIWQTSSPSPPQTQTTDMRINDAKPQCAADKKIADHRKQADIAEKNMRNLRASADVSVEAAIANLQLARKLIERKESKVAAALTDAQLVDSALKLKAITRKRRHSASQNYFHAHLNSSATAANAAVAAAAAVNSLVGGGVTSMQNNNNNEIANLNSYTLKSLHNSRNANELSLQNFLNASLRFGAAAAAAVAASNAKKCTDFANNLCGADFAFGCDSTAAAGRNQTIITCKYHLTAIEPLGIQQQNDDGDNNEYGLFTGNGIGGGSTVAPLSSIIDKNPSILKHVTMVSRPLTR